MSEFYRKVINLYESKIKDKRLLKIVEKCRTSNIDSSIAQLTDLHDNLIKLKDKEIVDSLYISIITVLSKEFDKKYDENRVFENMKSLYEDFGVDKLCIQEREIVNAVPTMIVSRLSSDKHIEELINFFNNLADKRKYDTDKRANRRTAEFSTTTQSYWGIQRETLNCYLDFLYNIDDDDPDKKRLIDIFAILFDIDCKRGREQNSESKTSKNTIRTKESVRITMKEKQPPKKQPPKKQVIEDMIRNLSELKDTLGALEAENKKQAAENKKQAAVNKKQTAEIEKLVKELLESKQELSALKNDRKSLSEEIKSLSELEDNLKKQEKNINDLTNERDDLSKRLIDSKKEQKDLESEIKSLKKKASELKSEVQTLKGDNRVRDKLNDFVGFVTDLSEQYRLPDASTSSTSSTDIPLSLGKRKIVDITQPNVPDKSPEKNNI